MENNIPERLESFMSTPDTLRVLELEPSLEVTRCLGQAPEVRLHTLAVGHPWSVDLFSRYVSSRNLVPLCIHPEQPDDRAISTIFRSVKRTGAQVVLPTLSYSVRFLAAHRSTLSEFAVVPPSPTSEMLDIVSDKWLLANFLSRHQLPGPPTILSTMGEAFEYGLRKLSFPVLLKPRQDLRDGTGIRRFENAEQVLLFLAQRPEYLGRYVVQSLIRGYDMGCNVLCEGGQILAYTIQRASMPSRKQYSPAAIIEFLEDERVLDLATELVSALGWSGVANIDLRHDQERDQVKILELNPRYWGSLLGSLSAGVNFPYLHCLAGVGVSFNRPAYAKKRFLVKEISALYPALRRRSRYQGRVAFTDMNWRYDLADPLPWVASKLVSFGSRATKHR